MIPAAHLSFERVRTQSKLIVWKNLAGSENPLILRVNEVGEYVAGDMLDKGVRQGSRNLSDFAFFNNKI